METNGLTGRRTHQLVMTKGLNDESDSIEKYWT